MPHVIRFDVNAKVAWRAFRTKHNNWVGICDSLRLTAEAKTFDELQAMIAEIQNGLFLDLWREGELHRFLKDHGWSLLTPLPERPTGRSRFDIPAAVLPVAHAEA